MQPLDLSGSEDEDNDDPSSEESGSENGMITAQNMEQRSRALDRRARREKENDIKEQELLLQQDRAGSDDMDTDVDQDDEGFRLPTTAERAEESQSGGVDLATVQRRIRGCTRVLNRFSKLAEPGR